MTKGRILNTDDIFVAATDAAKTMVRVEKFPDRVAMSLPFWLPNGSSTTIYVWSDRDGLVVSDSGFGHYEAELAGIDSLYRYWASRVGAETGVRYEDGRFIISGLSLSALKSATTCVADAVKTTFEIAHRRHEEKAQESANDILFERLVRVFNQSSVKRNVDIYGHSSHKWKVSNVVEFNDSKIAFEAVSKYANSVYSAVTKFHDLKALNEPPTRVSVVPSFEDMGDYVGILTQASYVVQSSDTDNVFKALVA